MMQKNIDLDTAIAIMSGLEACPKITTIPLENALDRILAEDQYATFPMPPFDKSPFDGFAFRAEDLPGTFPVTGMIAAGDQDVPVIAPGTAIRIFTGAPVPIGADVILKQEDTSYSQDQVTVHTSIPAGTNVIRKGETCLPGQLLARKGETLSPSLLGVLASQGIAEVPVFCKPKAVIVSTGSEVVSPGTPRPDYSIYNSSYYILRGYLERMGFEVAPDQIVPDDAGAISSTVRNHMESDADLVITTGGASVGDFDFAVQTAKDIGADILFWKIRMKPGGALVVSKKGEKVLLGLSGNPAAAVMCLLAVIQPYLRKLTGSETNNRELKLPLYRDMPKTSSAARMLRGHMRIDGAQVSFEENNGQRNADIQSFHEADLIAVIPGNSDTLSTGDPVRVIQLPKDLI